MNPPASLGHPESLDDLLLYRISRLLATAGGLVIRYCEGEFGITRREWRVLALLAGREAGCGPLGSSELAQLANLDRPRTSRAVSALVRKKLVSRVARPGDARHISLATTAEGDTLYRALFPRVAAINREALSVLTPAQMDQLDTTLTQLQANAEAMVADAAPPLANRFGGGTRRQSVHAKRD